MFEKNGRYNEVELGLQQFHYGVFLFQITCNDPPEQATTNPLGSISAFKFTILGVER